MQRRQAIWVVLEDWSGESMATKVIGKINGRIKFLHRKSRFLDSSLRRLLCNALVQPHFDYACSAWYPNLTQSLSKKLQITQNKCIRFCLQLGNRSHIGTTEFKQINWLPINERFSQCVCSTIFKFFNNNCPAYMKEMFSTYIQDNKHVVKSSVDRYWKMPKSLSFLLMLIWKYGMEISIISIKFRFRWYITWQGYFYGERPKILIEEAKNGVFSSIVLRNT